MVELYFVFIIEVVLLTETKNFTPERTSVLAPQTEARVK